MDMKIKEASNRQLAVEFAKDTSIKRFTSICIFLYYCYKNNLTPENSITYYNGVYMYIKPIK